jgi:hypothetical protein
MPTQRTLNGVLAMSRTHRLGADLDWVPGHARRASRAIRGATWAAIGAGAVGAIAVTAGAAALVWQGVLVGGAGAVALADRAARSALRNRIAKMAAGELALAELDAREEGELVVVRGTIEAEETLRGFLLETHGVYRRMMFRARGNWVHEAAVDFTLVDDKGTRILVQGAGARWLTPSRELVTYPGSRFLGEDAPAQIRHVAAGRQTIEAIERVLPVGTQVQIVGYKTVTADATGTQRDYRNPPERATLRSGPELPLVITRLDEPI